MKPWWLAIFLGGGVVASSGAGRSAQEDAVERGRSALLTRSFNPAAWPLSAYDNAWKTWDAKGDQPPKDYDAAFRDHYGVHAPPYANGRLPMGMREGKNFLGKGLSVDCLLCHGGSIFGKSYVGLGNASLDIQAFFEDLGKAGGGSGRTPFIFSNVRGTSEAGAMAVFLLSYREQDLSVRLKRQELGLRDDLCEDVPAWWLLKKKKTMYHTGTSDARSVRSIMQFMLTPLNSAAVFAKEEATFADIQAYIHSLEAPRYPFPIDTSLADRGRPVFEKHCARCHGSYGRDWTYPNKIVPIDVIGTDGNRFAGFTKETAEHYNQSWFARERDSGYKVVPPEGYQAPPLDGVWATAPYFHNGAAPTLCDVLMSTTRPKRFTRSFRTGVEDYDTAKVGWKVEVLNQAPANLSPYEQRKIYDTSQPGRGNSGHTFGDALSDVERRALIEYLKTL